MQEGEVSIQSLASVVGSRVVGSQARCQGVLILKESWTIACHQFASLIYWGIKLH